MYVDGVFTWQGTDGHIYLIPASGKEDPIRSIINIFNPKNMIDEIT